MSEGFIMNKIKIFRCAVPYAVILISVILGTVFLFSAKSIQILPAKYFAVLTASMAVIVFLIVWLLFADIIRHKEAKSKFKKITAYVLAVILTMTSVTGSFVSVKFRSTLDAITSNKVTESFIGVYVLKENSAQAVEDLEGYSIGFQDFGDTYGVDYALKEIKNIIGDSFSAKGFDTVFKTIDALYSGDAEAIVIDISYIELIEEIDLYNVY